MVASVVAGGQCKIIISKSYYLQICNIVTNESRLRNNAASNHSVGWNSGRLQNAQYLFIHSKEMNHFFVLLFCYRCTRVLQFQCIGLIRTGIFMERNKIEKIYRHTHEPHFVSDSRHKQTNKQHESMIHIIFILKLSKSKIHFLSSINFKIYGYHQADPITHSTEKHT